MFLKFYKSKVAKWVKNNVSKKEVIEFVMSLAIYIIKETAKNTKNKYDDQVVEFLEQYMKGGKQV